MAKNVLILILVDDGLLDLRNGIICPYWPVLILILVDDGLLEFIENKYKRHLES